SADGSKGAFIGSDGDSVYTLVVTPQAGTAGSFTVDVPAGVARDLAGNPSPAAPRGSPPYHREAPTPTISMPGGTARAPFDVTISFAVAVIGFTAGDVEITGGSRASSFSGGNGSTSFVLGITPDSDSAGEVTIGVPAGAAVDGA